MIKTTQRKKKREYFKKYTYKYNMYIQEARVNININYIYIFKTEPNYIHIPEY